MKAGVFMAKKECTWKPIKTAPRGDIILVHGDENSHEPYFAYYGYDGFLGKSRWVAVHEDDLAVAPRPSYWLPLPALPGVDE